jgi:mRNA interferase RelE/StbE
MAYLIVQKRRFARQYKKLHNNIVQDVDTAIEKIAQDPAIGERKKGDLTELFVYKFHSQNQLYLLGYSVDDAIYLI